MVQPFYVDTTGAWVLGYNQKNGAGSQLQAGARAELIPSPITQALSTFGGRIAAQTMQYMFRGNVKAMLNYAALRPYVLMEAVKTVLGESQSDKRVLNPAGAYSPVCYWLAKELSDTHFIEMDVAKTVDSKQIALVPYGIPKNFELRAVDLTERDLHAVQSERVDVLLTTGAYVNHADFSDMLRYIKNVLKDEGTVIATFPNKSGIENFLENSTVFSRIVNPPKGVIEDEHELAPIFKDTGFKLTHTVKFSDFAKKYGKPSPADIEVIVIAKLGEEEDAVANLDDEFDVIAELNGDISESPLKSVPPFTEFDLNSFKRFPKRHRATAPKSSF